MNRHATAAMFEKDIYQLIRGLRAHRGAERSYIQQSLTECRREVRTQDMDAKATALLKLVYLEMFGHDMSWASFNVLEVMSSPKYHHKRVGYLAAVQSFRPETEVLMLAENLLKKDLASADKGTIGLVLGTVPHVVNGNMAISLLGDLLPRLGHSSPGVRKKTVVTLYRLALVYPETLRPAWPKIRDRLLDEGEDPSVTAAIVNVVCELGWRRPQDFLPLAPRLFDLLTQGGNNWMAIKIIKLFAHLTPLEPRLVKKLLPPLTSIIKTTPAMSLLYECINGMIQGGIMEAAGGTMEGDEIARLCVNKLRAMLVVEGDPNLRYVALLAFAKITSSHADLVAQHQDVILECIDDPDISIRIRALDLVVGMINAGNLQTVVERLLAQLQSAGRADATADPALDRGMHEGIEPRADDDDEDMATTIRAKQTRSAQAPPLPDDYRTIVIERILEVCSRDTYANTSDFEWYVAILVDLVDNCPAVSSASTDAGAPSVADAVGNELLNVAVRVKAIRPEAAAAAQTLLLSNISTAASGSSGVLTAAAFIAGEYAALLRDPEAVLTALVREENGRLAPETLASYLQAVPKVFAALTSNSSVPWTGARKDAVKLLTVRVIHFLEPLTLHPDLEVQERSVQFLDLMRLASEACSAQTIAEESDTGYAEPPLLLTQAIPSLFAGMELGPVAPAALAKVPLPEGLDLDEPINGDLQILLQQADYDPAFANSDEDASAEEMRRFYYEKPAPPSLSASDLSRPAAELLEPGNVGGGKRSSYQETEKDPLEKEARERKRAERRERYKDDPYYIPSAATSGTSTPNIHNIIRSSNAGEELDLDAIPVMELKLDQRDVASDPEQRRPVAKKKPVKAKRRFEVAADETLDDPAGGTPSSLPASPAKNPVASAAMARARKSVLEVDSSGLSALSLSDDNTTSMPAARRAGSGLKTYEQKVAEEEEMARAIKEVERLRLEMQRRAETIGGDGDEGITVKSRKKKKRPKNAEGEGGREVAGEGEGGEVKVKRKKKKKAKEKQEGDGGVQEAEMDEEQAPAVKPKRKKKRQVVFDDGDGGTT